MPSKIYWSQLWVKTLHFQCNTLVMRKNRVSSANLSNLPALRHGLAKEDFQSERKTPVLSVQGGLVKKGGLLAIGSDFPVEHINPMYGFHAGVARQDAKNYPKGGFQMENAISREEALKGMTIWAAFSSFEENEKGSIEVGKMADFVVTAKDLMTAPKIELRNLKVTHTFVAGEKVFELQENQKLSEKLELKGERRLKAKFKKQYLKRFLASRKRKNKSKTALKTQ